MENKILTTEQYEAIERALIAAHNFTIADPKEENHSTCASFTKKPFHMNWHDETLSEVAKQAQLYIGTWVLSPLKEALQIDLNKIDSKRRIEWLEKENKMLRNKLENLNNKEL